MNTAAPLNSASQVCVFIPAETSIDILPTPACEKTFSARIQAVLDRVSAACCRVLTTALTYTMQEHAAFGYAAARNICDLLFCEAVQARGGEVYVVLPTPVEVHLKAAREYFTALTSAWQRGTHCVRTHTEESECVCVCARSFEERSAS